MADDPSDLEERRATENRMMASFIEMLSADAVVVLYSWSAKKTTKARMVAWGNTFATKGMLEWAYHETFEDEQDMEIDIEDRPDED